MNNVIDEVYKKYTDKYIGYEDVPIKELFIHEIKTNPEFSEKWGLKIEERDLSLRERKDYAIDILGYESLLDYGHNKNEDDVFIELMDKWGVPTKLITTTYNNIKTEIYESQ